MPGRLEGRVALVTGAGCREGWGNGNAAAVLFAREDIRCNAIVPGLIDTPMVRSSVLAAGLGIEQTAAYDAARQRLSPIGRQGSPWDIARAALFLASAESAYINGAELVVDGGFINLMPMAMPA